MHEHFFDHVNIPPANIHIPDGTVPLAQVEAHCRDTRPRSSGPAASTCCSWASAATGTSASTSRFPACSSRTRLCTLDPVTRRALASDFFGEWNVPTQALTMGLGTIFDARKILLLALGEHKAEIIREVAEGPVSPRVPASYLQEHADATVLVDAAAGQQADRRATRRGRVGNVEWTDALIKRAMLWLCEQTGKALLKLTDDDFRNHNLHQLLRHHGPAPEGLPTTCFSS